LSGEATSGNSPQSLVIVVPSAKPDVWQSLRHALDDESTVRVILDRRVRDRRILTDIRDPERRRADRRRRSDMQAELGTGRWIVTPCAPGSIDVRDPDARAILFLCCSHHVVPCQRCQDTYRLGWLRRADAGSFACPLCGSDLTPTVVAHARACRYWANHSPVEAATA